MCDKDILEKLMNENKLLRLENEKLRTHLRDLEETNNCVEDENFHSTLDNTDNIEMDFKCQGFNFKEQNEGKFKEILNNINDSVFLLKIDENGNQGKFVEVNDFACRKLGYSFKEMLNMSPHDISIHVAEKLQKIGSRIYKNKTTIFETTIIAKNGKHIPVEISTQLVDWYGEKCILAVARDISRRKEAEKGLKQSLEKQEKILSFLPDAVIIVNKNRVVYANDCGTKLLGYDSFKELAGSAYFNILHPDYHKSERLRLKGLEIGDKAAPLVEQKYIKKNGDMIDTEVTAIKIPYKKNFAFLLVARDISSRKQIEQLEEDIETTKEFNRILTEFFSNISHELKTPLNVILGAVQMMGLSSGVELTSEFDIKLNKYLRIMKQNCFRLLRLVNNLIDLSKLDSGYIKLNLKNHNIVNIIEDITLSVADYIENRGVELIFDTNTEEKIMAFDADKIERVMLNLLSNAIKFTMSGDKIMVDITDKEEYITISVKDTGEGIPEDKLELIFDRFGQVDKTLARNREGSGIGLALVKSLVDMHGGNIRVISTYGKGSEFIISIPYRLSDTEEEIEIFQYQSKVERISIEFSDIYAS
jgi:PAS domain S-box-containing protein